MVIKLDRTKLDEAIDTNGDPRWIVLLLSGPDGSIAKQIHDFLGDKGLERWRKYFLITVLDVLTEPERIKWFGGANTERYAVLKRKTKDVAWTGPVSELLRANGNPSILKIRQAFTRGRGGNQ